LCSSSLAAHVPAIHDIKMDRQQHMARAADIIWVLMLHISLPLAHNLRFRHGLSLSFVCAGL